MTTAPHLADQSKVDESQLEKKHCTLASFVQESNNFKKRFIASDDNSNPEFFLVTVPEEKSTLFLTDFTITETPPGGVIFTAKVKKIKKNKETETLTDDKIIVIEKGFFSFTEPQGWLMMAI